MGSDFTYSDIAGRKLNQDDHNLIKESDQYYFLESVPKKIESSIYSKIRYVISKQYRVIMKAIFYDLDGEKLKTLTNSSIAQVNEVNVVMNSEMENHQTKGRTLLVVQTIDVGVELKDDLFSIKGLKTQ